MDADRADRRGLVGWLNAYSFFLFWSTMVAVRLG